jgi:hypothetical protein
MCYYHPDRRAVAQCVSCGKDLCTECCIEREGQTYCKDCLGNEKYDIPVQETLFPAFLCGIVAGVLSAVPIIEHSECLFCLWAVVAGALAVFVLKKIKKHPKNRIAECG